MKRDEKITRQVNAGTRVYYVDLCYDDNDKPLISISEIPTQRMSGEKARHRIFVYPEYAKQMLEALQEVVEEMSVKVKA